MTPPDYLPTDLLGRILARIRTEGPLPFEDFQAESLYGAGGFFTGDVLRSQKAGDFLTSPEVSPRFGATIARFVSAELSRMGTGRVVEVAAGSGSLLAPMLAVLDGPDGPIDDVEAWAVEVSPAARTRLGDVVGPGRVVGALSDLPTPLRGVVVANELLDNLPVALAIRTGDGWTERWVGEQDGELVLVPVEARPEVVAWADRFGLPCPERGIVEVQLAAEAWIRDALAVVGEGTLLLIDYGDFSEGLAPRRQDGTLRTYRSHHLGPHPLAEPGETDITVDVNFSAMAAAASAAGAEVEVLRQDDFLTAWGLRDKLTELRHHELELARSDAPGAAMERLRVRSDRTEAETLLNPRGLGDFRTLIARVPANPGYVPRVREDRESATSGG